MKAGTCLEVSRLKARKWIYRTMAVVAALLCIALALSKDWWQAVLLLGVTSSFWRASYGQPLISKTTSSSDDYSSGLDNLMDN